MMKPTPNGPMFKSREEILAECATVGITPETPVVIYCFKGARSSNTLVALEEAALGTSEFTSAPGTSGHAIHHCQSRKVIPSRAPPDRRLEISASRYLLPVTVIENDRNSRQAWRPSTYPMEPPIASHVVPELDDNMQEASDAAVPGRKEPAAELVPREFP